MEKKQTGLPVKGSLGLVYALSLLTAALMAAASILGLVCFAPFVMFAGGVARRDS